MEWLKPACFAAVCVYASVLDVMTRTVPKRVCLLLLLTGLIGADLSSVTGFVLAAVPLVVTAVIRKDFGGGDVRFGALCGWVLQGANGLAGLATGAVLCLLTAPFLRRRAGWETIPLVPFLSAGCVAVLLIS